MTGLCAVFQDLVRGVCLQLKVIRGVLTAQGLQLPTVLAVGINLPVKTHRGLGSVMITGNCQPDLLWNHLGKWTLWCCLYSAAS